MYINHASMAHKIFNCSTHRYVWFYLQSSFLFSYHKFIRGKDLSKYSKKDLSGILGRETGANDECANDSPGEYKMDNSSAERINFSFNSSDHLHANKNCDEILDGNLDSRNDTQSSEMNFSPTSQSRNSDFLIQKKRKNKSKTEDPENELPNTSTEINDSSFKKKVKKRKLSSSDQLCLDNNSEKNCDIYSNSPNDTENVETNERPAKKLRDSDLSTRRSKTKNLHKVGEKKSSCRELKLNSVTSINNVDTDINIPLEINDSSPKKKVNKRRINSELSSEAKNTGTDETDASELQNLDLPLEEKSEESSKTENPHKSRRRKSSDIKFKLDSTSIRDIESDESISIKIDDSCEEKAKNKKSKFTINLNKTSFIDEGERNGKSTDSDPEIVNSAPIKKRKKKSVVDSSSNSVVDINCDEIQSPPQMKQQNTLSHEQCPSLKEKVQKNKVVDDFSDFMQKVAEFNASTDPKAIIEKFEKNKEALLQRYRQNYLRKYLESAQENDSRIYCDLNGDELDCVDVRDEQGNCEGTEVFRETNASKPLRRERHLTKAERIVIKARLLKAIQKKSITHSFTGSNLNSIAGYGNRTKLT